MQEGTLPTCSVVDNVIGYVPSRKAMDAEAVLAGFPEVLGTWVRLSWSCFLLVSLPALKGVSQAGHQAGLKDSRSCLISAAFQTFDQLPKGNLGREDSMSFCHRSLSTLKLGSMRLLRKVMLIENVGALLHKKDSCRQVFLYIQKAGQALF